MGLLSAGFASQKQTNSGKERKYVVALSMVWLVAVIAGMVYLIQYRDTPGMAAPRTDWPVHAALQPDKERDTLVMVAHPRCPCTKASMAELSRLMSQAKGKLTAYVIFVKPQDVDIDWENTDLWNTASAIPGVRVFIDHDGIEAAHFNAATSGQSMLYDKDGKLLFSGGITIARGHEGDNDGRSSIVSLLSDGQAEKTSTPVYGCPLFAPEQNAVVKKEDKNAQHRQ